MFSKRLEIHLSPWIIQDGNYPDLAVGDHVQFALDFAAVRGAPCLQRAEPSAERGFVPGDVPTTYDATGQIVCLADDLWVVDYGLLAYEQKRPPREFAVGDMVRGQVSFGIDAYDYIEYLWKRPEVPAMVYEWEIREIVMTTAPLIERGRCERGIYLEGDAGREESRRVSATNVWETDKLACSYVLHCGVLDAPPRRNRSNPNPVVRPAANREREPS